MAQFELSSIFSNATGKLGRNVISKGRDGIVGVRERSTPANPRTAAQLTVRAAQTESSQLYETMTDQQVQVWREFAKNLPQKSVKTGRAIKKQAINAFCQLADRFLLVNPGGTVPMMPPMTNFKPDTMSIVCTASAGKVVFTAASGNSTSVTTELLLQRLPSKNRVPTAGGYRTKAYYQFVAGGLGLIKEIPVPAGYYAAATRSINKVTGQAGPLKPIAVVAVTLSLEDGGTDEVRATKAKKAA